MHDAWQAAELRTKATSQAKVGQLELALHVDEQVLRLEIAMKHAVLVAVGDALQQLVQEGLRSHTSASVSRCRSYKKSDFDGVLIDALLAAGVEVVLQVLIQILKHKRQRRLGVNDFVEPAKRNG
jgi:hypothetical protein